MYDSNQKLTNHDNSEYFSCLFQATTKIMMKSDAENFDQRRNDAFRTGKSDESRVARWNLVVSIVKTDLRPLLEHHRQLH